MAKAKAKAITRMSPRPPWKCPRWDCRAKAGKPCQSSSGKALPQMHIARWDRRPDDAEVAPEIKDLIPVRSLWTSIRVGQQIIITGLTKDGGWVDYLMVGTMGHGGCQVSHLLDSYVMASETCEIAVRAN